MEITLSDLKIGQKGVLLMPTGDPSFYRRLQQFGLIEGTGICCVGTAPMGSPMLFVARGACFALRKEDCKGIPVTLL